MIELIIDPLGRETAFEQDDIGRRTAVVDDLGNRTSYEYNDLHQITKIIGADPDGEGPLEAPVTEYEYDEYHRLRIVKDPAAGFTVFSYDAVGNVLTLKDPLNNVTIPPRRIG